MTSKQELLRALREWRDTQARTEGVEAWRVLSNQALSDIVMAMPKTREELLLIKGIKERKFAKYGREILSITKEIPTSNPQEIQSFSTDLSPVLVQNGVLSVSQYLNILNDGLSGHSGRVQGEVSSLDIRGNYLFFGLKDKNDGSTMNCFMWMNAYRMAGILLEEGLEIIVTGLPEIYKPSGRFSFRANTAELVGEGALKAAYEKLRQKLEKEGLFAPERKKPIPDYPQRIGVITSKTGAVIHDFLNNIGRHGFNIRFIDSRVEGVLAVRELIASIRAFKKRGGIDILVMIRGGGSLESLCGFNNEALVREIAACPFPVIAGLGHDKDVPLAALAADKMCSTPTAVAELLNSSWEQAGARVRLSEQAILGRFESALREEALNADRTAILLERHLRQMIEWVRGIAERFSYSFAALGERIINIQTNLPGRERRIQALLVSLIQNASQRILASEKILAANNPERALALGWSIAFSSGHVVRRVADAPSGSLLDIRVSDGTIRTQVK